MVGILEGLVRRAKKRRLAAYQKKLKRLIDAQALNANEKTILEIQWNELLRQRDELLDELDLSDWERKRLGICPKEQQSKHPK